MRATALLVTAMLMPVAMNAAITVQSWGKTGNGQAVELYTLHNAKGAEVTITNYGARIVSIKVPDKAGKFDDIVLGFDDLAGYESKSDPYFGATIGRYANRIAGGKFMLDGNTFTLAKNNGPNSLHGGLAGFDKKVWTATARNDRDVLMTLVSPNGDEGFPGNLFVSVIFALTDNNELQIRYSATTDKDTAVNLTNHSYFNLAGQGRGDVLGHVVTIDADRFTPVDATLIPTGELKPVDGTPFDFRKPTAIGTRIDSPEPQLKLGGGYDHNYVLNKKGAGPQFAARVVEPRSGRVLEVLTTEPGVQFYTTNNLAGPLTGAGGRIYQRRSAFCLETQHFPDSPNHPAFPSTTLKPGETFRSETVYRFSVER